MKGITRTGPWALCLLALAPWLPSAVSAAAVNAPGAATSRDPELDEVEVTAQRRGRLKRTRDPVGLAAWLNRLRGEFTYDGLVELGSEDGTRRRLVSGASRCSAFGPSVNCIVQVSWQAMHGSDGEEVPGGISTLAPAMVIYALDLNYLGIQFVQVDSRGMADSGLGYLTGDTLTTTTDCVDLPGNCKRIAHIEAQPGGKLIRMQIDVEQDGKRLVRYTFELHRQDRAKR